MSKMSDRYTQKSNYTFSPLTNHCTPDSFDALERMVNTTTLGTQRVTHRNIIEIGGKLMDENQDDVKPVNLPEVQLAVQETEATVTRELRAALRRLHREMDEDKEQALHSQKQYYDKLSQRVARERDLAEEERLKEMSLHLENMKQVALREQQEHAEHERDKAIKQNLTEQATRLRAEFEHEKAQAVQEALKKAKELKSELNSEKKRASESLEEHTQETYRKHEQRVVESTRRACDEKARAELEQVQKRYQLEIDQLELRYATLEQKYCKNMNQKERVEADFKALQDDYKKFMDYTEGMFHSDYLMKLRKHGMKLACQVIPTVTSSRESTLQRSSARDMSVKSNHRHISAEESIHSQRCSSQRTDL